MAGFLGSDFDPAQPPDSGPRRDGAFWLRDIRTRLKAFFNILFDLETGQLKTGAVIAAALANTGVAPGTYKSVTVDAQGRVTAATNPTTVGGYGITDALTTSSVVTTVQGGTGVNDTPADGEIPIGNGTAAVWAVPTSTGNTIAITAGPGSLNFEVGTGALVPFYKVAQVLFTDNANIILLDDSAVGAAQKAYLTYISFRVNGGTAWAGSTGVRVSDTPNAAVFATALVAGLVANAFLTIGNANVTPGDSLTLGLGGTAAKGIVAYVTGGLATGGSPVVVVVSGYVKS